MFRPMRRAKQQLPLEECLEILKQEPRGVLSLLGDKGYPYGVPMDHWYCPEDGKIYFHCGRQGHKIDAIRSNPKASFCVMDPGFRREGEWALNIRSVIVFGSVTILEDREAVIPIVRSLSRKFTDDTEFIEREIRESAANVRVLALTPEHITGKLVNES